MEVDDTFDIIDSSLGDMVGLYVDAEVETTSVCDLKRQLTVQSLLFTERTIASHDDIISYAQLFGIPVEGTDEEMAEKIKRAAPCEWIERVSQWAKGSKTASYYLNRYVTDISMEILHKLREGIALSPKEATFLPGVDRAIEESPRPSHGFNVYRGVRSAPGKVGEFIELSTPKSGSFSLDPILSGYIGENNCCILLIYVPKGAIISYHPSEDQVIFPSGAQFYIMSGPSLQLYSAFGENTSLITYEMIYVGTSSPIRSGVSNYDQLPLADAYYIAALRGLSFPYGKDPYAVLDEADRGDSSYLQQITGGNVRPNAPETRFYLKLAGYDISPIANYNYEQLVPILKALS